MNDNIRQNLIAAGCDDDFIRKFDGCICDKRKCEKLLATHRRELLEELHKKEENISCLDYLVFMMKEEELQ